MPAQHCQQASDVMGQGGQPFGVRPKPLEPRGVHGHAAAERGHELKAVGFAVAVGVLTELGVAGPVPGVLDAQSVANVLQ